MAKELNLVFAWFLLCCFVAITRPEQDESAPWYIGCFNNRDFTDGYITNGSSNISAQANHMTPVRCVSQCVHNVSFRYAAVRNGSICICLTEIDKNATINDTNCNTSCHGVKSIKCGGTHTSSIYSTSVPLLVSLNVSLPNQALKGTSITITSMLSIKRLGYEVSDLNSIKQGNQTAYSIFMEWSVQGKVFSNAKFNLTGHSLNISNYIIFQNYGGHDICVLAYNLFSNQQRCSCVEVLVPITGLQLVTAFQGGSKLPIRLPSLSVRSCKLVYFKCTIGRGSFPEFRFDFGDGSDPFVATDSSSDQKSLNYTCMTVSHIFKRRGKFAVNVKVSNAISQESKTFNVHVGAFKASIELVKNGEDCLHVEANKHSILKARILDSEECIVRYHWNFNDSSPNKTTTVPWVSHKFSLAHHRYNVTIVSFYDHVESQRVDHVCPIKKLQGVIVKPEKPHLILETGEDITFTAEVLPAIGPNGNVKIKFHRNDRVHAPVGNMMHAIFWEPGRFIVKAEAENEVSSVYSEELLVFVYEEISGLSIHHESTVLFGKPSHLRASVKKGTNVTFYWDFGDGSVINTTSTHITHNYTRIGEHKINLIASNPLNNPEETSIIVLVTHLPACYPPAVTILGLNGGKVFRSRELRLEADVGVNCSNADQLIYTWKVTAASGADEGAIVELEGASFTREALIILPHQLDYGRYFFQLEVKGKLTGLASFTKVRVTVVKSHLVAVIKGGTSTVVAYTHKETVMDASPSYDPDSPDESHLLRFYWSCHPLRDKAKSCFNDSRTPVSMKRNQSVLKFQVDWLLDYDSFDSFEFLVTVAKDSRKSTASKVLIMNSAPGHLLSTHCLQCDQGIVNPTAPLVVMGLCSSCPSHNTNISYEWYIYHVQLVGSDPPKKEKECDSESVTDEPTSPILNSGLLHGTSRPLTSQPTSSPLRSSKPTSMSSNVKHTAVTKRSLRKRFGQFGRGAICMDPNFYGPLPTMETTRRPSLGSGTDTGIGVGSGTGKGVGTGSGVISNTTSSDPGRGDKPDKHDDDESGDLYFPAYVPQSGKLSGSIISLNKNPMRLLEKHTTTGLRSQNFVLLGGFFPPGQMYMVALQLHDHSTGQRGLASIYFNTSRTPECETCSVTPSTGDAMETTFQLTCSEKAAKMWPTIYRISYTVDGLSNEEEKRILVYSSYRSEVQFVLPPGLATLNYTVKIHVTIASEEVKRNFRPMQVRVLPLNMSEGVSVEEVLLNKTDGRHWSLLEDTGDEQGIRQFITALANSLNRLGSVKNVSSRFKMRTDIREKLLQNLLNFTRNDKNSAYQTSLALQMLTARPTELTETSVELASLLLQHLSDIMQSTHRRMRARWIESRFFLSEEFIKAITGITSDLIEASSLLKLRNNRLLIKEEKRDDFLLKATEAAENLVKARLSVQVLGEKPLLLTSAKIRVNASQTASIDNVLFSHAGVKFHMPVNLEKHLGVASAAVGGNCYGAVMTVYKENPFFSEMHHSQVGSLSLSKCNGEDIEVRNLSRGIDIFMPHEHNKATQRVEKFTLQWKHENFHVINETKKMSRQSLHIHLEPLSKLPAGFAVKLIVSTAEPGSSVQNRNEHTASTSREDVFINMAHHQLENGSGSVYVRVVMEDRAYYRIRSINKGPSFTYLLSIHWMGCFYWNKKVKEWSTDGCKIMDHNTEKRFHCRCNHLTAFSGAFLYPPNSLTIKDLTDTAKLERSPLALALVIIILLLYIVLLGFCIKADKHDKKKTQAVYITENTSGNKPKALAITERFQITMQTGHWFGSGTSANVFLLLHGANCVSDPIELKSDKDHPLFERSSCDVFVVSFPRRKFSDIWKIHIWHDNSGDDPNWFLEQVIIKDVNRGDTRVFNCNRWLAVDEADGKVDCELLETTSHPNSLKKCFSELSMKSISDYHLWFSLLGRPSYSRFTRAQRLTSCVSLLLSYLCVNIAWYRPKKQVMEVLGLLDITGESLWIGFLCSLVALPLNLLWIFLFRYSRRKFRRHVKVYPMSEPQTDSTELMTSVLDHSLETVGMLTNISDRKRWFRTVFEWDDVDSDSSSCMCGSQLSLDRASDSTSQGYNSGQGGLSYSKRPIPPHADLLDTCEFLRDIRPVRKKSLDFDKRSTYSVSLVSEDRGVYHSRFSLPHGCVYVAWSGCLCTAVTAALLTVWYGVSFGWDLSVRWLQSLFFSLLESFLISQPFMVVIFILYMAYKSNARKEDEDVDEGFEDLSSSALHDIHYGHINQGFQGDTSRDGDDLHPALALRRRQRYLKFLKPPSESKLSEARSKCARSKALRDYIIEVIVSILFFLVTCFLVTSITCPDVYHLNHSIKKSFLSRPGKGDPDSVKAAWKGISSAFYENNASSYFTPFTILLRDSQSLLFGRTTITQFKTTLSKTCHGSPNTTMCRITCHEKEGAWFSLELNQTSEESAKQLRVIADSQWIDACTREVKVEFVVYTPIFRAISAATLSVKASYTGKPLCRLELNTLPVFFKSTGQSYFVRICKLLFVVLLLYLLRHEFYLAKTMSAKYFRSFWRLTQLLTVASASFSVVLYIHWSVSLYALLRDVQTTSQTDVFYYAKMVSSSQEALQALYALLLFFIIVRSLYMLRPFRTMVRISKYFASVVRPLAACLVVIVILMMAFVHTGHLLFGGLHKAFKSFGDTFLLVSNFFRLEGVSHYQGPGIEEHPVLILFYFTIFVVGFCTFMRGATATMFMYRVPHYKKKRHKLLAVEEFFRNKVQLLREKLKRRESDTSSYADEDEEDEEDEGDGELEEYEKDAPFPMEHVLDEVQVQFEELSLRMGNLMGSEVFDNSQRFTDDLLSGTDSDEDVEYLYQAEQRPVPSLVSGSGYESDHSDMSAAKWNLSSSSCYDLADCHGLNEWRSGLAGGNGARPVKFTSDRCKAGPSPQKITAYPSGETSRFQSHSDPSCSSCYDMCRSNPSFTLRDDGIRESAHLNTRLRDGVLREGELRGSFLRDGVWYEGGLHDSVSRGNDHRDRPDVNSAIQSDGTFSRDQSFYSTHSQVMRPKPEPIMPKNVYFTARAHGRRSRETLSLHPSANVDCSTTEVATSSASELEVGRKGKKSRRRKTKGFFRSSAVYPGEEGLSLGLDSPVRGREAHSADSQHPTTKSPVHAAWGLALSASERGFLRRPASHASEDSRLHSAAQILLPSSPERSFVADPCHEVLEDSQSMISAGELESTAAPDPHIPDGPLKGILGNISLNKPLGTEILPDDSPVLSTPGDNNEIK